MGEPRVIKRYANRKLYDTQASRYVTLDQIADLVRAGEDVSVIDNTSKEDLTSVTLAQIIFEEEKKQKSFLPLAAMRNIIQSGGESLSGLMTNLKEGVARAEQRMERIFRRERPAGSEEAGAEPAPADGTPEPPEPIEAAAAAPAASAQAAAADAHDSKAHPLRELIEGSQQFFDEWQRRIDERIRYVVQSLSPFSSIQREVATLTDRIAQLERQISALDDAGGSAEAHSAADATAKTPNSSESSPHA